MMEIEAQAVEIRIIHLHSRFLMTKILLLRKA